MGSLSLHRYHGILVFLGACLVSFTPLCNGGNILVFPVDGSHWINMKILLEELHANGHTLTVLRASTSWYIPEKSSIYTSITLEMGDEDDFDDFFDKYLEEVLRAQIEGASALTQFKTTKELLLMLQKAHVIWSEIIDQLLGDEKMVQSLRDAQYDLVLTDPAMAQGVLLAKYLKLPVVLNVRWATSEEGHFMMAPSPLSYVPVPGSGLTDKMDFFQRIKNVFFYGIIRFQQRFMIGPGYDTICSKYIEGRCDIDSLLQEADIWLFRSDFVFDFPRPTMPNIIYIGGFQCKPPQPLPADLEAFVQSAGEHGVIIMTLGTLVKALPSDVADEIAAVFAKMPQKVIWKHSGPRPSTVGNNTLLVDWMPQKDLLGHPQTKAFVAHGGTNGVQEAIYHGVPVLGIPLFFDQYDNLLRLQARGAGKILLLTDINGQNFEQRLKEVLHDKSYRENIQRMSRLHRDQPMSPMERAVFWLEYVIRNKGAPHLRTEAYKMPWYAYHSFDVFLFLFTVACVLLFSVVAVFRFLCCRRRRSKTKTKQQ